MPHTGGSGKRSLSKEKSCTPSPSSSGTSRARKRKRCELRKLSESDLESEFEDCNMEDAIEIEKKLRKVAKSNALSDNEMRQLLQKFVKNEHVLALVTLKAEDELARERRQEAEQRAIIITDTPSVAKLTRSKARELNRTPGITLPSLSESLPQTEIAALIKNDDLHSDDEDEEYTFKEEDFISDDDQNTTASDLDSNPRTPQTPLTATEYEDSPVKFSADGCFKIPLDKQQEQDLRIATRTRSKFCLEQTTIEDLQSEFVPPDVEQFDINDQDTTANDADWMQFLNDFSKPLNNSFVGDDDDPINDPEYIAAEKVPVDAEELRDINISKKELTELVAELFEGLLNEGISLESVDLETPQKFLQNNCDYRMAVTPESTTVHDTRDEITRQIDFDAPTSSAVSNVETTPTQTSLTTIANCIRDATNLTQSDYSFHPNVMSTPSTAGGNAVNNDVSIPIATDSSTMNSLSPYKLYTIPSNAAINSNPELIAVPVPGQPNSYQIAKVVTANDQLTHQCLLQPIELSSGMPTTSTIPTSKSNKRYAVPYDNNFTWEYISVKKHIYAEYMDKFESLRHLEPKVTDTTTIANECNTGLTSEQHDMLQQQLRIHVQMLTQSFLQTYSHPKLYDLSDKPKKMLHELQQNAIKDASFNAWNLNKSIDLITKWEHELSSEDFETENEEMMSFMHKEIELTDGNTRQVPRLPPRIMQLMLNSNVFMYPQYLPRMAFQPKRSLHPIFAPSEYQLIAMGLEKHTKRIQSGEERIHKSAHLMNVACKRLCKDTTSGKSGRRIIDRVKELREDPQFNPVQYFFKHNCAPPIDQILYGFEGGVVLTPKERYAELPRGWQYFMDKQSWEHPQKQPASKPKGKASEQARNKYLEFVREAVGEDIPLPESFIEAAVPDGSATDSRPRVIANNNNKTSKNTLNKSSQRNSQRKIVPRSLTINVNYIFGGGITNNLNSSGISVPLTSSSLSYNVACLNSSLSTSYNNSALEVLPLPPPLCIDTPSTNYSYNHITASVQPELDITELLDTDDVLIVENSLPRTQKSPRTPKLSARHRKRLAPRRSYRTSKKNSYVSLKYRQRSKLRRRCRKFLDDYQLFLRRHKTIYYKSPHIQFFYIRFKALELYTDLLQSLKMFCRQKIVTTSNAVSPTGTLKRQRANVSQQNVDDDNAAGAARSRKANRQEENFRHMLLPDTPEEANRKDAIFAFNFYEKVEETLISANRLDDCKKFNNLLKTFDPKTDKVADLYNQMEKFLLPEYPELAQVFLTFLLPSEAAEIGKFFEHFMITNASTFINKLNIYFNKQPAQLRKIYACLSELADIPNVSMKQVESKILPLLKGNQFLVDWFMQQFPNAKPPERLLPLPEHINLKDKQNYENSEAIETVTELLDSPTQPELQGCQLKYINGRIFYGTKIMLPAKLSFMATSLTEDQLSVGADATAHTQPATNCIHGIQTHGEQRLEAAAAAAAATAESNSDDNERSEEDDVSRALIIDTTCDEDSSNSLELCDDATLRGHAVRLNPSYYGNACFNVTSSSTPNMAHTHHSHHHNLNAKKTSINFNDDCRISPRKNSNTLTNSPLAGITPLPPLNALPAITTYASSTNITCTQQLRDKRKSPTKKNKSPVGPTFRPTSTLPTMPTNTRLNLQPMVVIHEQQHSHPHSSAAIACAKKLKSLIEADGNENDEQECDTKLRISIVARAKKDKETANTANAVEEIITKTEEESDNLEFLPENANLPSMQTMFPPIKMDLDTSEEYELEPCTSSSIATRTEEPQHVVTTAFDSDEDNKLDVVATLANCLTDSSEGTPRTEEESTPTTTAALTAPDADNVGNGTVFASCVAAAATTTQKPAVVPWTRDEDKVILIEMKLGARNRDNLFCRIRSKLANRTLLEITARHQFLMDFLSKLQGK